MEERNVKDITGSKKAPLRFVPASADIFLSGPFKTGAEKHGPFNWRTGPPPSVSFYLEAILRHFLAYKDGEDFTDDSLDHHLDCIAATCIIIRDAEANGNLNDDRVLGASAELLRERINEGGSDGDSGSIPINWDDPDFTKDTIRITMHTGPQPPEDKLPIEDEYPTDFGDYR